MPFTKEHIPWNKGKKWDLMLGNTNGFVKGCIPTGGFETRFKKGHKYAGRKRKNKNSKVKVGDKLYHPLWNELRKLIYKRDNWHCQECGIKCSDASKKRNKNRIQCHHIDYNTENNDLNNLITLCASCHMKTNYNRIDWINRYSKRRIS